MTGEAAFAIIEPIIRQTYGTSPMALALAGHLAEGVEANDFDSRGREYWLMVRCWDWFSGGTTADHVAQRIEAKLLAREETTP